MKIYIGGNEVNQEEFLDHMVNTLRECYKMDYSRMESYFNLDKFLKEIEDFEIIKGNNGTN